MSRSKTKLKKGDRVRILTGKDAGKEGKILRVLPQKERIVVERINVLKRHMKQRKQTQPGGIIEKEGPIHLSNVMLVCPSCNKVTRIGRQVLESGDKARVCKKCGQSI